MSNQESLETAIGELSKPSHPTLRKVGKGLGYTAAALAGAVAITTLTYVVGNEAAEFAKDHLNTSVNPFQGWESLKYDLYILPATITAGAAAGAVGMNKLYKKLGL